MGHVGDRVETLRIVAFGVLSIPLIDVHGVASRELVDIEQQATYWTLPLQSG